MSMAEGLTRHVFKSILDYDIPNPIPRMTYQDAMDRFGVDRPDTRFEMGIVDLEKIAQASEFKVFKSVIADGGQVRGINAKGCGSFSRKQIDDLRTYVGQFGAKGLAWIKVTEQGLESSIVKFFPEQAQALIREEMSAEPGDLLLFAADQPLIVADVLGNLRL